jgi:hypothetical protein
MKKGKNTVHFAATKVMGAERKSSSPAHYLKIQHIDHVPHGGDHRFRIERRHRNLPRARPSKDAETEVVGGRITWVRGPDCGNNQGARVAEAIHQQFQKKQRSGVRPMQIFEHKHDR